MTTDKAIEMLQKIKFKYGGLTPVYFDCLIYKTAYTPEVLELEEVRVIMKSESKSE